MKPNWDLAAALAYRTGESLTAIGKTFGVHPVTVWRHLKAMHVKMRPVGRPLKVR